MPRNADLDIRPQDDYDSRLTNKAIEDMSMSTLEDLWSAASKKAALLSELISDELLEEKQPKTSPVRRDDSCETPIIDKEIQQLARLVQINNLKSEDEDTSTEAKIDHSSSKWHLRKLALSQTDGRD